MGSDASGWHLEQETAARSHSALKLESRPHLVVHLFLASRTSHARPVLHGAVLAVRTRASAAAVLRLGLQLVPHRERLVQRQRLAAALCLRGAGLSTALGMARCWLVGAEEVASFVALVWSER